MRASVRVATDRRVEQQRIAELVGGKPVLSGVGSARRVAVSAWASWVPLLALTRCQDIEEVLRDGFHRKVARQFICQHTHPRAQKLWTINRKQRLIVCALTAFRRTDDLWQVGVRVISACVTVRSIQVVLTDGERPRNTSNPQKGPIKRRMIDVYGSIACEITPSTDGG